MPLKFLRKVTLSADDIATVSELAGVQVYARNVFEADNQDAITDLMKQGQENAFVYLQRNRLGQKLSLFEENNIFQAVVQLQKTLGLQRALRRIECYDISHLSGKFVYGSMVTFVDGRPAKKLYRLFKCPNANDDFANHREVLTRRIKRHLNDPENPGWALPDLIIVDGGKGQLSSDFFVLQTMGVHQSVAVCGLAKQEEEMFVMDENTLPDNLPRGKEGGILLNGQTKFLVQRIRDEAHRFAITNNRKARLKTVQKSALDDIAGVGPKTKNKLLSTFGSVTGVVEALEKNPQLVDELVGSALVGKLQVYFGLN